MKTSLKVFFIILITLILDQWLKVHIKLSYEYGEETLLLGQEWARLKFVENPGMAFGMELGGEYGKIILSVFRIFMVTGLIWYMRELIKHKVSDGFVYCIGLITAGALGNIIDSAVYGMVFTESSYHSVAQFNPSEAYGTFLHGRVVDMFYFPIKYIEMPDWIPYFGGESFLFFSPIFNVADAAISVGLVLILLFQNYFFKDQKTVAETPSSIEDTIEKIDADVDTSLSKDIGGEHIG